MTRKSILRLLIIVFVTLIAIMYTHRNRLDIMYVVLDAKQNNSNIFYQLKDYIDNQTSKLKVYIPPEFGSEFNTDFEKGLNLTRDQICLWVYANRSNFGHGEIVNLDKSTLTGQFDTNQFSTDLIFHDRLTQNSDLLVNDIEKANVVYIPFMFGTSFTTHYYILGNYELHKVFNSKIQLWLNQKKEILNNKKLLLFNSRIGSDGTVSLQTDKLSVRLIGIEPHTESTSNYKQIATPYATFSKFIYIKNKQVYQPKLNEERNVHLFFAGSGRNNIYRSTILRQIQITTLDDYKTFMKNEMYQPNGFFSVIFKIEECKNNASYRSYLKSYEWKTRSNFCLEPPGDSRTRRSFWDSIFLGCVPVIFRESQPGLPFWNKIDYDQFVLKIESNQMKEFTGNVEQFNSIFLPYFSNKTWLKNARDYMTKVRQFLQFTWMYEKPWLYGKLRNLNPNYKYDAYGMLLAEVASTL